MCAVGVCLTTMTMSHDSESVWYEWPVVTAVAFNERVISIVRDDGFEILCKLDDEAPLDDVREAILRWLPQGVPCQDHVVTHASRRSSKPATRTVVKPLEGRGESVAARAALEETMGRFFGAAEWMRQKGEHATAGWGEVAPDAPPRAFALVARSRSCGRRRRARRPPCAGRTWRR